MEKHAVFTICAKNYLAQALALKDSIKRVDPNLDFFIFISDDVKGVDDLEGIISLNESWIPSWKSMAFKYNVIEFSTSIKPFCFGRLFDDSYEKVIYLDPDTYVTSSLDVIFNYLEDFSIVLTPHYCNIQTNYVGSITEEEILFVGIYNLGFTAIKNNSIGLKIISWWKNRLQEKCYADKFDALHVDQKWMDFIPAFYPTETLITHNMGINPAIWNLHERELVINVDGEYQIRNIETNELFPLTFFHFSGFDPFNPKLINRRHPKYNTDVYPSFLPIFERYINDLYLNGYDRYAKLSYSFNSFDNGENIIPLHRRLFRVLEKEFANINPFEDGNAFMKLLADNKLLTGIRSDLFSTITPTEKANKGKFEKLIIGCFRILKRLIGIRYYASFLNFLAENARLERQIFLIKRK